MTVVDAAWVSSVPDARRRAYVAARSALSIHADEHDWNDSDVSPPTGEASKLGYAAVDQLVAQGYASSSVATRGKAIIDFLFKPNTVDAAISPDDDGLSFYWAAQEMSLTVIVYPYGYWWSVRNIAGASSSGEGDHLPLSELEHSLNWFSKEVERRNPGWRSIIR